MFIENTESAQPRAGDWVFVLYVAGKSPNSLKAIHNMHSLAEELLPGRFHIQIIDVLENPLRAIEDGVLLVPTLVKISPGEVAKLVGSLSNRDLVLSSLGLVESKNSSSTPEHSDT